MFIYSKYKQLLFFSLFSFILGCTLTSFFLKIDDINTVNAHPLHQTDISPLHHSDGLATNSQKYLIIMLVITSPENVDRRNGIRETWFMFCKENVLVRCYFALGVKDITDALRFSLGAEQENNNDLILLPNIVDSYSTLTQKVLASFLWVNKKVQDFQYILKCDDDSFVRVNEIVAELKTRFDNEKGLSLYWGFFDGRAHVKKQGKWQDSKWNVCDRYLPYALGGGYVLSQKLVKYIARNSDELMLFQSEDVSVGLWLAPVNVNRQHDCRFDTEFKSRGCSNLYLITHKQTSAAMRILYATIMKTDKLCAKEFKSRSSYIYNWSAPPSLCCVRSIDDPNII